MPAAQATFAKSSPPTLSDITREHLAKCSGDVRKAQASAIAAVLKDKRLTKEVVADAVCRTIEVHAYKATQDNRRSLVRGARLFDGKASVSALAGGIRSSLLDFPLPGGKRLADALPGELASVIEYYEKMGADVLHKARWLRLVVQSVPRDRKIGDVITAERAQELFAEAAR